MELTFDTLEVLKLIYTSSFCSQENGAVSPEEVATKLNKVKIDPGAKKKDGTGRPTMRKKSVRKKKLTDEEIMTALSKLCC